jgi:hypothetical protein
MKKRKSAKFMLDADLITLRAAVAVVDEGSFSGAAKKIGRTQTLDSPIKYKICWHCGFVFKT